MFTAIGEGTEGLCIYILTNHFSTHRLVPQQEASWIDWHSVVTWSVAGYADILCHILPRSRRRLDKGGNELCAGREEGREENYRCRFDRQVDGKNRVLAVCGYHR